MTAFARERKFVLSLTHHRAEREKAIWESVLNVNR
jgi:hypothetical protein